MRAAWLAAAFAGCALAQPAAVSPERIAFCNACHGEGGVSQIPGTPSLAAQPTLFVENQLVLIREGVREVVAPMAEAVKGMKDAEIRALASHYAKRPPPPAAPKPEATTVGRAQALIGQAHCGSCHLPDFSGRDQIPRLSGQRGDYLFNAMREYRDNRRSGGDTLMADALRGFTDPDLTALASYFASRP